MTVNSEKEVYFEPYCESCKYCDLDGSDLPCNACLTDTTNTYSHKPTHYEEAD